MSDERTAGEEPGERGTDGPRGAPPEGGRQRLPREVRHDLRSNIGQVIGYSELWLDEIEDAGGVQDLEALRRDLGKLLSAGRKILEVVDEHIDPVSARARGAGM